ncbi:MAG: hypothetical protein NVS3B2_08740 [Ramlibacter sp.]
MIKVGTLAKIRRLHLRDGVPIKEIERRTGMARNTIKTWLRKGQMVEPKYPARVVASKLDGSAQTLATWLKADARRGKRDRRTVKWGGECARPCRMCEGCEPGAAHSALRKDH